MKHERSCLPICSCPTPLSRFFAHSMLIKKSMYPASETDCGSQEHPSRGGQHSPEAEAGVVPLPDQPARSGPRH